MTTPTLSQPPSLSIRREGRLCRADVPCPRCQALVRVLEVSEEWVEVSAAEVGRARNCDACRTEVERAEIRARREW